MPRVGIVRTFIPVCPQKLAQCANLSSQAGETIVSLGVGSVNTRTLHQYWFVGTHCKVLLSSFRMTQNPANGKFKHNSNARQPHHLTQPRSRRYTPGCHHVDAVGCWHSHRRGASLPSVLLSGCSWTEESDAARPGGELLSKSQLACRSCPQRLILMRLANMAMAENMLQPSATVQGSCLRSLYAHQCCVLHVERFCLPCSIIHSTALSCIAPALRLTEPDAAVWWTGHRKLTNSAGASSAASHKPPVAVNAHATPVGDSNHALTDPCPNDTLHTRISQNFSHHNSGALTCPCTQARRKTPLLK